MTAATVEDALSTATGKEIRARRHRNRYPPLIDKEAADRLVEQVAPSQSIATRFVSAQTERST
jgi:hypothetical protein